MAGKTPINKLDEAIVGIMEEYVNQVNKDVGEVAAKLAKEGAKTLRNVSRQGFPKGSGAYAKGWKVKTTGNRYRQIVQSSTIYNVHAGLPHLLEHGHVNRNGTNRTYGKTPGHEHISPVEEKLVEAFEKEVLSKL